MKDKRRVGINIIITILLVFAIGIFCVVTVGNNTNKAPSMRKQKYLELNCTWNMEYNDNNQLTCGELYHAYGGLMQAFSYEYDEEGKRVKFQSEDHYYGEEDDSDEVFYEYEFEDGKLKSKSTNGYKETFLYKEDDYVQSYVDSFEDKHYDYHLNDQGKVCKIINWEKDENPEILEEYSYNEMGYIESYTEYYGTGTDGYKRQYTYEYDEKGRYSKITYDYYRGGDVETSLVAEFVYDNFSNDCTAYTYDFDNRLVGKYEYVYDARGNLVEVSTHYNEMLIDVLSVDADYYCWGLTSLRNVDNYPGGELPDDSFEASSSEQEKSEDVNTVPLEEMQEELKLCGKWAMEYDENNHLLNGMLTSINGKVMQSFQYQYDEEGNRIKREVMDGSNDSEPIEVLYEYEEGKLLARTEDEVKRTYSYEEDNYICSLTDAVEEEGVRYLKNSPDRYYLTEDGKASKIASWYDELLETIGAEYRYNEAGQIESYIQYYGIGDGYEKKYSYEYDTEGRYSKICFQSVKGAELLGSLEAEFIYEENFQNYLAYVYNCDGNLVGKYEYVHDEEGNLIEVLLYYNVSLKNSLGETEYYLWGTTPLRMKHNYPGGELPDNFLEDGILEKES